MDYKDYYSTLGVSKRAEAGEIQKAYRKLARKYHPDVNKTPEAEGKFKEINEAYEVLKDPDKREKYDRFGSAWRQAQRSGAPPHGFEEFFTNFAGGRGGATRVEFDGAGGFSSFFDTLFGGARGPQVQWQTGGAPGFSQAGADHDAKISLTLEEAARGGRRELGLSDPSTGKRRTLRVTIPAGIKPGQRIRLAGQGGVSSGGGARGDLFLTVDIRPHAHFRLEGADLHTTLPVSPWEAALGGSARVPTLEGDVTVKVPAGSSSGRRIRLRGRGFPSAKGDPGDLLAEIRIVVPETLDDRERELFEELAENSEFRPRS